MTNVANTDGREESNRVDAAELRARAAALVDEADALVAEVLAPGRWPQARTVQRFVEGDRLERVLARYTRAMRLDPDEPAYPWNLASTLNRLGLNHLALGFMAQAIHTAQRAGEEEWSGADAFLALAEIALDAEETDLALTSIARAQELQGNDPARREHARRLLEEVKRSSNDPSPQVSLAQRLLQRLTA